MSAAPSFLALVDQDERDELADLGIDLERPASDAEIDAMASVLLRRMGELQSDTDRFIAARNLEIAAITARYERLIQPKERAYERCEVAVESLALRATFGKRKSRDVGFGAYGTRQQPARLDVVDPAATLAWAREHAPELVRAAVKVPLIELVAALPGYIDGAKCEVPKKALDDYCKSTGEIPPGVIDIPAEDQPFAKPASPLAGEK